MLTPEVIANSIFIMITNVALAATINHLRAKWNWGIRTQVILSSAIYSLTYLLLVTIYFGFIHDWHLWRSAFYPESVAIEGDWLEIKNDPQSGRPCSIVSIVYHPNNGDDYVINGVTASINDDIEFASDKVWSDARSGRLAYTFEADNGTGTINGFDSMRFIIQSNHNITDGTGFFIDREGRHIDFKMRKIQRGQQIASRTDKVHYLRKINTGECRLAEGATAQSRS